MPWSEFAIISSYLHICSAIVGVPHRPLLPSLYTLLVSDVSDDVGEEDGVDDDWGDDATGKDQDMGKKKTGKEKDMGKKKTGKIREDDEGESVLPSDSMEGEEDGWEGADGEVGDDEDEEEEVNPAPYTSHPARCTLHPTPYTLHPTPYTLHPATYSLQPTP